MDYDNNDFQGHNNRLSGEESSKLSPVLQPYALPKFDFDDNLQGHLGFDTLVENEVFLGISSQDDNQWIEDFSRGSSGIEFSSSATESCSISRCNNVWSEATSSESVEMLLKSVGHDEGVLEEAIIEESDAGNELGRLTEKMEPNLKQDDKMEDNSVTLPALSADNVMDGADGCEDSAQAEHPTVVCTSEPKRDHPPDLGCSGEVNSNILGVIGNEGTAEAERKCDNSNRMEVEKSGNKLQTDNMKELSSVSALHVEMLNIENASSVSHNVFGSSGEINSQRNSYQVTDISAENVDALLKDNTNAMVECHDRSKDTNVVDQRISGTSDATCTKRVEYPLCVDARVESLVEQKVESDVVTTSEEPSGSHTEVEHHLHLLEESKSSMTSTEPSDHFEAVVRTEGAEMCNHIQGSPHETSDVVCQGDKSPKQKVIEVDNTEAVIFACPEQKVGAVKENKGFKSQVVSLEGQNIEICNKEAESSCLELETDSAVEKDMFHERNVQMDTDVLVEGSVFVDHKSDKWGVGSATDLVGDLSTLTGECSSAKLLMEQPLKEDKIPKDYKSSLTHVESVQPKEKELSSEYGDVHNCDQVVAFPESQNVEVQTESIDMECKVAGILSSGECGEGIKLQGSEFSRVTKELESNADERHPNLSLCNTLIGGTGVDADTTNEQKLGLAADEGNIIKPRGSEFSRVTTELGSNADEENPSSSLGNTLNGGTGLAANADASNEQKPEVTMIIMEADNEYAAEIEGHKDTGLSYPKEVLEVAAGLEPVSKDGKASQGDQAVAEAGKECAKNVEVCSVPFDSTVKHVGGTEAAESEKHSNFFMEGNAEASVVEVPVSVAVSMTEPFLDHREKNNEVSLAPETQITEQIVPSTKDHHQASVALACPSIYGSESLNGGGGDTVYLIEDNHVGQQLAMKETTKDSVQHFKAIGADGTDKSVPSNSGDEATRGLTSFTSELCPSSSPNEGKTTTGGLLIPNIQVDKVQTDIGKSPVSSKSTPIDLKMVSELSHETPQAPVGGTTQVGVKGTPERKTRRASGKTTVRSVKKRNNVKETTPLRQSDKRDKSHVVVHTPRTGPLVQFEELKPGGDVARSGSKPSGFLPIPTSNLPDLNTSVPAAAFFQQTFTVLQQVQLRAQIFVYGSLIQDSAPDEACMISAFDPSEGGSRNLWEPTWRACVERVQVQKSLASKLGTPIQSRSGSKAPVQPVKHSALQNKVLPSPAGRASSKRLPSPAVSPMIPLSSPLWNVSTLSCDGLQSSGLPRGGSADGHQTLSPLHPYQVPGIMNVVGHSPSWLSPSPFTSPWMASTQTSAFDSNAHFSMFPNTEPLKLTTAKDSSMTVSSLPGTKAASFPAVIHDNMAATVSIGISQPGVNKVADIPRSADSKPRKRKKVPTTEDLGKMPFVASNQGPSVCPPGVSNQLSSIPENVGQKFLLAQSRNESVPTVSVSTLFSTSVAVTAPSHLTSLSNSGKFPATMSPAFSRDQPNKVDQNVEKKSIVGEETSNTVEEARLHAETAALHAADAVSRYHDVWSQLAKQKKSGLISDVEAKLASAAVAITAATSVAKAAAAAAKIASNVAVQAKLMADEVSSTSVFVDQTPSNSSSKATSSAILKGGDGSVDPGSIIAVAREAAKKRVQAASAASKHAENLDAIVKAAELAAEAVAQAGKILSIGDSSPLNELKELGTVGTERDTSKYNVDSDQPKTFSIELNNFSAEESKGGSSGKITSLEKESFGAQRGNRASELAETTGVVPEPEAGSRTVSIMADDACTNAAGLSIENGVDEGCVVEVFKDGGNCKAAWYSASILNLKDGKAFLCYTDLQADDGTGLLKEWVPLQGDCISKPTIRIAHPTTAMRFAGTRRKRKAAVMDHCWSVGDRIDAWMENCWREGVVKEKNKIDETTLTILFPATGDTSVVRTWHLRPTLTWQDGKWTESSPRHHSPFQGDRPQEKRLRLGSPVEARGKDKIARGVDLVELGKHDESKLLPLAGNEIEFNAGKDTIHESKQESHRTMRTGLQKEGSRVVFGVPKPGKKRKFMDVSKHFDSDQSSKNVKTGDSFKFGRYVAPQISGSHGWKNSTKIDVKEKKAAEDKPKVLRSGKPPNASSSALPRKDNITTSVKPTPRNATVADKISEDAISSEENDMSQQNMMEFGSVSDSQDTSEGQTLAYSQGLPKVSRKRGSSSNARSERLNKGKSVPSAGRIGKKVELQEKLVPEVAEPRRSNRTIQPTSRLLEGLQSSLSISKIPFSHEKTHRSQSRSKF